MPFMNGFDVLAKLREKSDRPVIMLSARGEAASREEAQTAGANSYIIKPFNVREVLDSVSDKLAPDNTARTPAAATIKNRPRSN